MNETGQSFGSNPASLKGKLQTLEVTSYNYTATNQEHLPIAKQSQERSTDPQILKGYPRKCTYHENRRCQEKPFQ
jgi:hypothetical protein